MKNTGIEYEKIVQKVFQSILDQKSVENITVKHDITLQVKALLTRLTSIGNFPMAFPHILQSYKQRTTTAGYLKKNY